ncbi:hypothetical protein ABZ793_12145 [Micromonospora sp. NPDC047465]|uniref:hypothetical protein n=1 Tax=Micromonospora sp. NPDC047465 TaxID=3154813 RepID=UPI0033C4BFB7
MTCWHCGSRLDATGQCPGTQPLLDPRRDGHLWGTAAQLAHHFGTDVTTDMVHNWRKRDGLKRYRVGRDVYSPVDQTASIERDKRLQLEETGRGRPRRLDATLAAA